LDITSPKVRVELRGHSFVTGVAGDGVFGAMHRVLASFLREKSRFGGEVVEIEHFGAQRVEHAAAVRAVESVFRHKLDCQDPRNWKRLGPVRPHAEFLVKFSEFGLATLGGWLGSLAHAQGDLPGARKTRERVLDVRRRALGEEHKGTLRTMNNLAQALKAQGDLGGARMIQEQVLDVIRRALGEDHTITLTCMNNLAQTLKAQGDLAGARTIHEQVLDISPRVLGAEHPDTLMSMDNLACTLKAQGDLPGARKIQEQVLALSRRVLGEEHPDALKSMGNLANTLKAQRDLQGARKIEEQVLGVSCRVLGSEHPDTVASAWNLFRTLEDLKDEEAAKQVLTTHLVPLLQKDPATLSADLRKIQSWVKDMR
jgi:tetratricopeptide (TPR) repeat protein